MEDEDELRLHPDMEFETWELAESYITEYAKQQGFCFRKKRRILDPIDNTITRRRTYIRVITNLTHGGVITPDISPIQHYSSVIYCTNVSPDSPCRNELRHRNAVILQCCNAVMLNCRNVDDYVDWHEINLSHNAFQQT